MTEKSQSLLPVAQEFTFKYGIGVLPVNESKCPVIEKIVDRRGRVATDKELEDFFGLNGTKKAQWLAAMLDSPMPLIALDLDGSGLAIFQRKMLPRCSQGLQSTINLTMRTKTPSNGVHIVLRIRSEDFPEGIHTKEYWNDLGNGKHNQINLMGRGHFLVERGPGYESINGPECLVTLSKIQVEELLNVLGHFESETKVLRKISGKLSQYYQSTNRHNIALRIAGYLHKNGVPEYLICDLIEYLILSAGGDEESEKRYQAVRDTCSKKAKTDQVSGSAKLLEAVNGDDSVIVIIQKEFSKLGYHFSTKIDAGARSETDDSELAESEETPNPATALLNIVKEEIVELFKDQLNNPFAAIRINGHVETIPIPATNSGKIKMWVCKTYYEKENKVLSNAEALIAVCNTLRAKALFGNFTNTLSLRVSNGHDDSNKTIYYDLTNKEWQVVKITQIGWRVEESNGVPIMFRRFQNQRAQVTPSREYPQDIFDKFLNLINIDNDEGTRCLLKCYIISLFIPDIAKAALMLHGPEGAAKTACQELIKSVVDPSVIPTLTFPRDIDGLIQQFSHNYVAYYDNVSILPEWLSDALCRAVTGTGFSKRELYSDDDDVIYQFLRCIGFNGINLAATKSDLLDRGIIIGLKRIDNKRMRELKGEILPEFQRLLPQLLGYIFDILVKVLKVTNNGGIKIKTKSRMADFEKYAEVISQCMGYDPMRFLNAYHDNKKLRTDNVLENSPVARAVIEFMESRERWRGTNPELLAELESVASSLKINTQRERLWPKATNILGRRLNEIKSNLEEVGILVNDTKEPVKRTVILEICKISLESFEPFENKQLRSTDPEFSKDMPKDILGDHYIISFENSPENNIQNQELKGSKDSKGILQPSYGNQKIARVSRSNSKTYICQWCRILYNRTVCYQTSDFLEEHTENKHAGWTAYPGPADIQKFEQEQKEMQQ